MSTARNALWESGHDESVQVNQRALIDKVLARYSGEFTVFRELLQNSDDASARKAEIHFETKEFVQRDQTQAAPSTEEHTVVHPGLPPDLKAKLVNRWTFRNDGMLFRDEDWNRLKKIAEGNPDEEKIGAFGVGFYSLFSVTEEPFVTSGDQWMGFYWKDKGDQLFARRGQLPTVPDGNWTTFEMDLREPTPIPQPFDFTRFLASSITFMRHLLEVSVFLDGKRLSRLTKDPGAPRTVPIPRGLQSSSPLRKMHVKAIQTMPLSIKAEVMHAVYMVGSEKPRPQTEVAQPAMSKRRFFSSLFSSFAGVETPLRASTPVTAPSPVPEVDPETIIESTVVLSIFSADVDVRLDAKMVAELNRSTKKNPPTKMKYELIYTGKTEYDASKAEDEKQLKTAGSIFQGLRADIDGHGAAKVFIGHSTAQTTGLGGHMSARFIPTVERESIDLVDRNVSVWNKELLYVGGFLSRAAYEIELDNIRQLWSQVTQDTHGSNKGGEGGIDPEIQTWLRDRAIHALKFFTFRPSAPSALVSSALEEAFFACGGATSFSIVSSTGVRDALQVRYPDPAFVGFIKRLPMVPDELITGAAAMVDTLRARRMIQDITFMDVIQELRARPLSETEMVACFKWWVDTCNQGTASDFGRARTELLNAAILSIPEGEGKSGQIIPMSSVQSILNVRTMGSLIPTDGPLPAHLLPVSISRHFDPMALSRAFGWRELTILEWLKYIIHPPSPHDAEHNLALSAPWAERVLGVLSRAWPSLPRTSQDYIVEQLGDQACIPTSAGLRKPNEAYFKTAHVFHDLPILTMPSGAAVKGPLEKVLQALGVRRHVNLQIVFDRMIRTGDWTIAELIKYLVAVQSTLTVEEMEQLRATAAFPRERTSKDGEAKIPRSKASDLYEPSDVFREMQLPVIDWGTQSKWRATSDEGRFLFTLGLRRYPPLADIINLCANSNETIRTTAFKYFLDNFTTHYSSYRPDAFSNVAFIPALNNGTRCLAKPQDVVSSPGWALLGFWVVDPAVKGEELVHLKIQEHPSSTKLINVLRATPPQTEAIAREWFGTLATRIAAFTSHEFGILSQTPFIPTKGAANFSTRFLSPLQCFFKGEAQAQVHSKLFVFVDFGQQANVFLSACGVKSEPSMEEVTKILLDDPKKFYQLAEGRENYLTELRNIAINRRLLSTATVQRLRRTAVLIGSRRVKKGKTTSPGKTQGTRTDDLDEDDWELEYDLLPADKVVIANDQTAYQLFGHLVFSSPQEDLLEEFYEYLGSPRLSSLTQEEYSTGRDFTARAQERDAIQRAGEMHTLILERLPLFLHEHTHTRTLVQYSWLNKKGNFIVKIFEKLIVTKSLRFGSIRASKSQDASAFATRSGKGPIELCLAGFDEVDMYEVSTSMCRLLFESAKANDALLFMTILSTDLKALRRRGYNVDRILRRQEAERTAAAKAQAEDSARVEQVAQALLSDQPAKAPAPPDLTVANHAEQQTPSDTNPRAPRPTSMIGAPIRQSFDRFKNRIMNKPTPELGALPESGPAPPAKDGPRSPDSSTALLPPQPPHADRPRTPQLHPTPRSSIASNIGVAIRACKEERGEVLKNRQEMQTVKEALNEGYCDVSGHSKDMVLAGEMGGIKVFVERDLPDMRTFMTTKHESLARFIYTILPLREVYTLPSTSVHIFYDRVGELIAFNRNSSLFLNLRYFEQWHDTEVQNGQLTNAYIAWYFTLAHEIAHNLVQPHNSEHEFYFSSICEQFLPALMRLLTSGK